MMKANRAQRYRKIRAAFEVELGRAPSATDGCLIDAAAALWVLQQDQIAAFLNGRGTLESAIEVGDALLNTLEVVGLA
jgi:hypothetical protein